MLVDALTAAGIGYADLVVKYATSRSSWCACCWSRRPPAGRNIYGHDMGSYPYAPRGTDVEVTEANYAEYLASVEAGGQRNGVGPLQLTHHSLQDRADQLGGCWDPAVSIRVGVDHFGRLWRTYGEHGAYERWRGIGPGAAYADHALTLLPMWRHIVEEATVTRMLGADYRPISYAGVPKMQRYDVACLHTIVGNDPAPAAHFSVRSDGWTTQSRDTAYQSAANYQGNPRVIAIETDDQGAEFGDWDEADGHAVPGWTAAQMEAIARVLVWCHRTHGIPLVLAPDSRPTSRGVAYHRMGIDGNWAGYAYGGRVSGGEVWTLSKGKVCPGDRRIKQLIEIVIPRARVLAGLQEDDMPLTANDANTLLMGATTGTDPKTGEAQTWPFAVWLTAMAFRIRDMHEWTAELAGREAGDVDEAAIAANLAPMLVEAIGGQVRTISDEDLARLSDAFADEQDRRARDNDPATGPTS